MLIEKKVTFDRETGRILEETKKEVPGDPTPYTDALSKYFASIIKKNQEEK